jgi:cbb3-type cytochrome oxidase maturation protein
MSVIYLLLGVSMLVALIFVAIFFWAVKQKQFDDKTTPAMRILFDDKKKS